MWKEGAPTSQEDSSESIQAFDPSHQASQQSSDHDSPYHSNSASVSSNSSQTDSNINLVYAISSPYLPYGYSQALRNRIDGRKLDEGGRLHIKTWPPIFVYDLLQFPGTLAALFGKPSAACMVSRMTPGKLKGFSAFVLPESEEPVLQRGGERDHVKGMLLFGRGRNNRRDLNEHFGEDYVREKVEVEVELQGGRIKSVKAYMWLTKNKGLIEASQDAADTKTWTPEEYIAGSSGGHDRTVECTSPSDLEFPVYTFVASSAESQSVSAAMKQMSLD
ncbi:hypothetical protein M8818_000571 [Zalaria obscura]|uniref:Uncharacterized protein n=1 Tax=Zalaria obscura TaxID=2024903 RepID=A0ACC3SNQ7_9PEZI